ncbi:hypothetical protein C2I36_00560 [Rhodobacteraceae bacterium WD3A24]|nr:hypothetical protein C2I36_00560 [Rhodobacteraceae bacterium WD3A24]
MSTSEPAAPVQVIAVHDISPSLRRVTLRAPDGRAPSPISPAAHCHLFFPEARETAVDFETRLNTRSGPPGRVFTYRRIHTDGSFDVDFVRHAGEGPAARWLRRARPGTVIGHRGPGRGKLDPSAVGEGGLFILADMTALPAALSLLENAPRRRDVQAIISVRHSHDDVALPASVRSSVWLIAERPGALIGALRTRTLPAKITLFAACEAAEMRMLRRYALDELGLDRSQVVTSGYWKRGLTAEQVDRAKRKPDWLGDLVG